MAATTVLLPPVTPADYHRIVSPTLRIPSDPQVSIPVGILACQRDPLLRSLVTTVVSTIVSQPAAPPSKKPMKKAVISPEIPSDPILEVILHDTVIFPEGGGQPTDTGIITTHNNNVTWQVVQAKRHGGHAVHYVRVQNSGVEDALLAFSAGTAVTVALDEAGFERRYDHMSMHTSQHLLSALLETRLNLPTLSWSLTSYPSPCYVEVPRRMSVDEITTIQNEANRLVFQGRRVHVEVKELEPDAPMDEFPAQPGRAAGRTLPEDYTGGVKRVIVIDGVDRNPCCGTHLPSIHNLQMFLLPHTDAVARSSTTCARLYFLAGPRLITYLTTTHDVLTQTASILSCGAPLVPERVTQVVEERKTAEKRGGDVESELAGYIARDLIKELSERTGDTISGKHVHRTDDTGNALGFLSAIASAITNQLSQHSGELGPYLIAISSSPSLKTSSTTNLVLIVGSDEKKIKELGEALKTKLGVKGGGKGPRWSGKFTGIWKDKQTLLVKEALNEVTKT